MQEQNKKEGQLVFKTPKEEKGQKERYIDVKLMIGFKRLFFYLLIGSILWFAISRSQKLIVSYQNFYALLDAYREQGSQNNILLVSPKSGDSIQTPFILRGEVKTTDDDLFFQLRKHSNGEVILKSKIDLEKQDNKEFDNFNKTIEILNIPAGEEQTIILELYLQSTDGEKSSLETIPLIFKKVS